MRKIYSFILVALTVQLLQSCSKDAAVSSLQPDAAIFAPEVAIDWMNLYRQTVKSESKNPPQASRIYAYAAIGLYEAIAPDLNGYHSLRGQVSGLDVPAIFDYGETNYISTVNEAMYKVALKIFGALKPENIQAVENLHNQYISQNASRITAEVAANSKAFGNAVAQAVLNRADNDNFAATRNMAYTVPVGNASYWQPTGAVTNPLEPYWGTLKSFTMPDNTGCTVKSTVPFSASAGSPFYNQALEVLTVSQNLTQEQKNIALWWADNAGATPTPPGHWVGIEIALAQQYQLSLKKAAEMFVLTNMAMADAFISCWNEKYKCNLLRPQTYIRSYIAGNASWTPLIATPPFPEYPSGHSVASGAAADILATVLGGDVAFKDDSNVALGLTARNYHSLTEAANEAAMSRLYGGIHYREAIESGVKQGKEVSKMVLTHIRLKR